MAPPILTLNRKLSKAGTVYSVIIPKNNVKIWLLWAVRLQLDVAKKKCPFKYKIAIMLLHIHKFLLRAYHSMQSTLPCHHGSRGALQQQWEEKTLTLFQDEISPCELMLTFS